ncbi:DegT/DnrJ/EryC1/StrS family aminotransferase [Streptomyces sp. NPDC002536]
MGTFAVDQAERELYAIRRGGEDVLKHANYVLGPEVELLEGHLAKEFGIRHAVGCNSGFGAHLLSLLALGIGPLAGDTVLVSAFSPASFAGAVLRRAATVKLADVAPGDVHLAADGVHGAAREVQAVVVHHLFGAAADMPAILEAAGGTPIMEVASYSLGAAIDGKRVGTFGTIGTADLREKTSLGAYGDAGLILTDDDATASRLREIRRETGCSEVFTGITAGNFHMDTLHAAILLHKLEFRAAEARQRALAGKAFLDALASAGVTELTVPAGRQEVTRLVVLAEQRDELARQLNSRTVKARPWWPVPIHLQPGFRELGHARGDFPNAEDAAARSLEIPLPQSVAEAEHVAGLVAEFYGRP